LKNLATLLRIMFFPTFWHTWTVLYSFKFLLFSPRTKRFAWRVSFDLCLYAQHQVFEKSWHL
jgi:hypothetical protein